MDNATLIQHPTNFQFLSVCHYITSFGLFFYHQNLISLENRNHSVSVLNTFFDYIHNSKNETETKLELLQKVLAGSDLYGGGENEPLDMKYVNESYQYIVSSALFSHYGNIHGYLAGIISRAENITYTALKENVLQQFRESYISRDYCSSRFDSIQLTSITIEYVFNQNIWSMFPEPEKNDMEIMDVNYIYAMIGLKVARSVQPDSVNLSFDNCILLSRGIELQTFDNESYELALELFATPALFYYARKHGEKLSYANWTELINSDQFWQEAYKDFFHFINIALQETVKREIKNTLHYKLDRELEQLKSRTLIATTNLQAICQYSKLEDVPSFFVDVYKTVEWTLMYVLPDNCRIRVLPNLKKAYDSQFDLIGPLFSQIEHNSLEQVLAEGDMIETLNSNVTVKLAQIENYPMRCTYCSPTPRKKNADIYLLFAIIQDSREDFYALRQENNSLTLLTCNGNEREFSKAVANESSLKMDIPIFATVLKHNHEDYKVFIQNVAKMKTDQFVTGLKTYYRDPTSAEKVIDFMKSLVPFYTCIENIESGNRGGAAISCSLDVFSLFPLVGVTGKYSSVLWSNLVTQIGKQKLTFFSKSLLVNGLPFTGIGQIYKIAVRTVTEEILTQQILKDFSIASLRTLDPGFELSFQLCGFFNQVLRKLIRNLAFSFRNIREIKNLLLSVERGKMIKGNADLSPDHTGLIPKVIDQRNNYKIVRYLYPGGSNFFGPMCVSSFGKTAELRTVEGDLFQIPVIAVKSPSGDSISYREFLTDSGQISEIKYKMGGDHILRKIGNYLNLAVAEGKDISVLRNYHVYHNTIEWNNKKNPQTEVNNQPNSDQMNTETYIFRQDPARTVSLLEKFTQTGLIGLKKDNELISFRKIINSMDSYQSRQVNPKSLDLWFTETLTRPSIVDSLKNRKGKDFYFNDLTLLSDTNPSDIVPQKISKYSLKTEVRYQLHFKSQYGLVDISTIGDNFKSQYIVYPQVEFKVADTEYINGKEILLIKLEQKGIGKEEWVKIRERVDAHLEDRITQSRRSNLIEEAALTVASNTPLHRFTASEQFLRGFLLRIDGESPVPTYDTLAKEIYSGATIPEKYNEWRIKNHMFIDDVLFQSSLHQVATLKDAKETINFVYSGIYNQVIEFVFEIYHNTKPIRYSMRFEDFYVMYSYFYKTLTTDVHAQRRVVAAICRLALRQSRAAWVNTPITIYYALNLPKSVFSRIIRHKTGGDINFSKIQAFYSDRDIVVKNCRGTRPSEVLVLYELEMANRAGIADLTYILNNPNIEYYVPHEMTMTIRRRNKETIQGRDVFVLTLHFDKLPVENRLVDIVNKLNELYSTGSKFYHVQGLP